MRAFLAWLAAALCGAILVSSCGSDGGDGGTPPTFKSALLNGAQETPAVTTFATGSAFPARYAQRVPGGFA